ncbi:MAG: hypothetical protein LBJ67_16855 [Planctomycetaceae bacterium]|jgi:hypothetical protein|nr:hypothetical protein [Planctomycetaceae bacterium]
MTSLNITSNGNNQQMLRRNALTLMEVLATVFVLAFGLMAVLSAIPFGAYQLNRMNILDSSGACGRGALAQIRLADWYKPETLNANGLINSGGNVIADPFIVDPLGMFERTKDTPPLPGDFGQFVLNPGISGNDDDNLYASNPFLNQTDLDRKFVWGDDTIFAQEDSSSRPTLIKNSGGTPAYKNLTAGEFSWLYMITPVVPQDNVVTRAGRTSAGYTLPENIKEYNVAAVVFHRRDVFYDANAAYQPIRRLKTGYDNPAIADTIDVAGGRITLNSNKPDDLDLSSIKWILLVGRSTTLDEAYKRGALEGTLVAQWYRIAGSDEITQDGVNFQRRVFLIGPQWEGASNSPVYAVLCDGVVNVYQTTMPK